MCQLVTTMCPGSSEICFSLPSRHTGTGPPCPSFFHKSQIHNSLPLPSGSPRSSPVGIRPTLIQSSVLPVILFLITSLHARRINSCQYSLEVVHLSYQPLKFVGPLWGRVPVLCWFASEGHGTLLH